MTGHIIIALISLNRSSPIADTMAVYRKYSHTSQSLSKAYGLYELTFGNWHGDTPRTTSTNGTQTPTPPNQLNMSRRPSRVL